MDTSGPIVSNITLDNAFADITTGTAQITARVHVTDATGVAGLPGPYWFNLKDVQGTRINSEWKLVSGNAQDGIYSSTVTIPSTTKSGEWLVGCTAFTDSLGFRSTNGGYSSAFYVVRDSEFTVIYGSNSRNFYFSSPGIQKIFGGTQLDTISYVGLLADYSLNLLTGWVADTHSDRDGLSIFTNVERLKFNDTSVALDYQAGGHAGQAFRLYKGVLGREGEPAGLGYVMNRLDQGETLKNVASGYLNSPEFHAKYGNADQATFINLLYKNILGRAADSGGTTFINNWIAGGATREDVTLGFTESPEYIAQCATLIGNDGIHYTPVVG